MRKLFTAGAALLFVATGLVAGPGVTGALATSEWCQDSWPRPGTTDLVTTGAYLSVEQWVSPALNEFWVAACISDTPPGEQSLAYGSSYNVYARQVGPDRWDVTVRCEGDGTATGLLTVNCLSETSATTTLSTSPGVGFTASGFQYLNGSTVGLGTTGVNTGDLNTTSGSNPDVTYSGTCATVAGITPPGTMCTTNAVDVDIAPGDLTPGTPSGSVCLVSTGGSCVLSVPKVGLVLFRDTTNPTGVSVLGVPVFSDPGSPVCVGIC